MINRVQQIMQDGRICMPIGRRPVDPSNLLPDATLNVNTFAVARFPEANLDAPKFALNTRAKLALL